LAQACWRLAKTKAYFTASNSMTVLAPWALSSPILSRIFMAQPLLAAVAVAVRTINFLLAVAQFFS